MTFLSSDSALGIWTGAAVVRPTEILDARFGRGGGLMVVWSASLLDLVVESSVIEVDVVLQFLGEGCGLCFGLVS